MKLWNRMKTQSYLFLMFAFVYHLSTTKIDGQYFHFVKNTISNSYELAQAGFFSNHNGLVKHLI